MNETKKFEKVIQQSLKLYLTSHSRSNKKLIPIHSFISNSIKKHLKKSFTVHSLPEKEINVQGRYNSKKVDICVQNKYKTVGTASVKFIMSNYKQNANNYFENCTGELINLSKISKTFYLMITFDNIPYYNQKHEIKSFHNMHNDEYTKYLKLIEDGYLNNLCIIKMSNGKLLKHPQNITNKEITSIDFSKFKIKECFPDKYEKIIKDFALKCIK